MVTVYRDSVAALDETPYNMMCLPLLREPEQLAWLLLGFNLALPYSTLDLGDRRHTSGQQKPDPPIVVPFARKQACLASLQAD